MDYLHDAVVVLGRLLADDGLVSYERRGLEVNSLIAVVVSVLFQFELGDS